MRYQIRNQILDLLSSIMEGISYIEKADLDNSITVSNDCLLAIQSIWQTLRSSLSEQRFIYYDELMIKIKKELNLLTIAKNKGEILTIPNHEIKKLLDDLMKSLQDESEVKLEVLFLPYKFSMWDSLESIWLAAKDDSRCDCYVMPIPYYDRDEKGRLAEFNYEGKLFLPDVPIVSYQEYNIAKRRPDIIYFHNPYDGNNLVTSVSPEFYTDRLKLYTDMLVYVPYYIGGSSETTELNILPSYRNATKLIVESNNSKKIYMLNGLDDEKVLDLGSPKIDAMLLATKDRNKIPQDWEKVIGDKKCILFNTGISNLLKDANKWIDDIEQMFKSFIENKNCVFIWRPHPLTDTTLKSMRTYLIERYEEIKSDLESASNIIIDKNGDVYPAVSASDGMISDYSSVMLQYIITGKPVLGMLSKEMLYKERYYSSDYLGCYFPVYDTSVAKFVELVENNTDFKKKERLSKFIDSINNSDGTCGKKIHGEIKAEVLYLLSK